MIYFNYKMCIKREKGAENAFDHRRVNDGLKKIIKFATRGLESWIEITPTLKKSYLCRSKLDRDKLLYRQSVKFRRLITVYI